MKDIFEKFRGSGSGYCSICYNFEKLKFDHVPPQCVGNKGIYKVFNFPNREPSITAKNGVGIRSICENCNSSILSQYDTHLGILSKKVKTYLNSREILYLPENLSKIEINPQIISKAICGHILSCSIPLENLNEESVVKKESAYFEKLRNIFFGKLENIVIECFIHEHTTINIYPIVAISMELGNPESIQLTSLLSFYPVGFFMTEKKNKNELEKDIYLDIMNDYQILDLKKLDKKPKYFPLDTPPNKGFVMGTSSVNISAEKLGKLYF